MGLNSHCENARQASGCRTLRNPKVLASVSNGQREALRNWEDTVSGHRGATEPYDFSARCVNAQDPHIYSSPEPSTLPVFGFTRCACAHAKGTLRPGRGVRPTALGHICSPSLDVVASGAAIEKRRHDFTLLSNTLKLRNSDRRIAELLGRAQGGQLITGADRSSGTSQTRLPHAGRD